MGSARLTSLTPARLVKLLNCLRASNLIWKHPQTSKTALFLIERFRDSLQVLVIASGGELRTLKANVHHQLCQQRAWRGFEPGQFSRRGLRKQDLASSADLQDFHFSCHHLNHCQIITTVTKSSPSSYIKPSSGREAELQKLGRLCNSGWLSMAMII